MYVYIYRVLNCIHVNIILPVKIGFNRKLVIIDVMFKQLNMYDIST